VSCDLFGYEPPPPSVPPDDVVPDRVADLFERFAIEVANRGFKHYSSDAILHRIRWTIQIELGEREFKCNDHWTAPLARWFLANHPELENFFEMRVRTSTREIMIKGKIII
jgi:hypothetical protein